MFYFNNLFGKATCRGKKQRGKKEKKIPAIHGGNFAEGTGAPLVMLYTSPAKNNNLKKKSN